MDYSLTAVDLEQLPYRKLSRKASEALGRCIGRVRVRQAAFCSSWQQAAFCSSQQCHPP